MSTQTVSPISKYLERFDGAWILRKEGSGYQRDRHNALNQARQNVSNMPYSDTNWLYKHLAVIQIELANKPGYEQRLRLELTAFAVINYLYDKFKHTALHRVVSMNCPEFNRFCRVETVE